MPQDPPIRLGSPREGVGVGAGNPPPASLHHHHGHSGLCQAKGRDTAAEAEPTTTTRCSTRVVGTRREFVGDADTGDGDNAAVAPSPTAPARTDLREIVIEIRISSW